MGRERKDRGAAPLAQSLLDFLRGPDYRPLTPRQLLHRVNLGRGDRDAAHRELERLIDGGKVVRLPGGRVGPAPAESVVRGQLERHPDGFGFVVPESGGEDLFVPGPGLGEAMSGDVVEARVRRRGRSGRPEGDIVRILTRRSRLVLGVFEETGPGGIVHPFDATLRGAVTIPASFRLGAAHRDVVEIHLMRPPGPERPAEGKVLGILGGFDTPGIDIEVAIRRFGLTASFPREVAQAERALPARIATDAKSRRTRFDDPPPVTIDGETAQDFDDAIAVAELPRGGFRLWVHIADVSHFVAPGDVIDLEARRRGTSVYFPGRVLPMLPEKLSNDLCSLRPGVDRLVHTAILDLDAGGVVRRTRFADGVIRSAARLTYTQVAELIDGGRPKGIPPRVVPMLQVAERLRAALRAKRKARGGIDVDLPEPRILLDVEGVMTGITIEPRNRAHQLIEECMIAANEAVAGWLEDRGAPCMFRNHDRPDPLKLEQLADFAGQLGYELPADPEAIDARAISRLLEAADGRPERPVLGMMALRSMQQARYAMSNHGHFGLASTSYCHFTSPIRRYPDLVVHRLLRQARARRGGAGPEATEGLDELAAAASERERNAEAAERDVLAWKKVAFIAGREGELFDGLITGVARFGLFVQLAENLVEGLVKVERLGPEYFEFDERRVELVGTRSGKRYRMGETVRVRVDRVDRVLRRVDLGLEGVEDGAPSSERPRSATQPPRREGGQARGGQRFRGRGRRRRS